MNIADLPALNAFLNGLSSMFLISGFVMIKRGKRAKHRKLMVSALGCSLLFLISYTIYHYNAGSVPYPYYDWTRTLYFTILIPHIILAAVMGPFIIAAVIFAFKENFTRHKKLVRWVWPVWMFVSITGVVIYLMLYQF